MDERTGKRRKRIDRTDRIDKTDRAEKAEKTDKAYKAGGGQLPELLAPAGSMEAFRGALSAGADAVYLAGEQYGARAYAANFSEEEILQALEEAHLFGRQIYLTVNTLTRQEELEPLAAFVRRLTDGGLDGAIVQDLGVLRRLRRECPELELHASTQMSAASAEDVRFLKKEGVCRVVPARELSLSELRQLKREEPIALETFIHGAMCYCYSGKCLFSSFIGGRSGNRGRCAQPCRLPYAVLDESGRPAGPDAGKKECYPLSMKDLCALDLLPQLVEAGIDSFKIEGRMKKPEYAAGVTAVYRKYMDLYARLRAAGQTRRWRVEKADRELLQKLYLRTELCTGYYQKQNGRELETIGKPGYRGAEEALLAQLRERYIERRPTWFIDVAATLRKGEAPVLRAGNLHLPERQRVENEAGAFGKTRACDGAAACGGGSACEAGGICGGNSADGAAACAGGSTCEAAGACGEDSADRAAAYEEWLPQVKAEVVYTGESIVQAAQSRPLTREEVEKRLRRTGDTGFAIDRLTLEMEEDIFLPVSALNELRRGAVETLRRRMLASYMEKRAAQEKEAAEQAAGAADGSGGTALAATEAAGGTGTDEGTTDRAACHAETGAATSAVKNERRSVEPDAIAGTVPEAGTAAAPVGRLWAQTTTREQWEAALSVPNVAAVIDDSGELLSEGRAEKNSAQTPLLYLALPHVMRAKDRPWMETALAALREGRYDGALVRTVGEAAFLTERGYLGELIADAGLYTWNRESRAALERSFSAAVYPYELSRGELAQTFGGRPQTMRSLLTVYGHLPMMITAGCVKKTENACTGREAGFWKLRDRKGQRLPVRCVCRFCYNVIYNSVPLSLHAYLGDAAARDAAGLVCAFTTESAQETRRILAYFAAAEKGVPHSVNGRGAARNTEHDAGTSKKYCRANGEKAGRGQTAAPVAEYTTGHYKKGAE